MPHFIYDRHLDLVEGAHCEGCGKQFEVGELATVPCVDVDLQWCEACRKPCAVCTHIKGVHFKFGSGDGCDGNHGEPGECACAKFNPPAAIVTAAKAIPGGIWMSDRFRARLREEGR